MGRVPMKITTALVLISVLVAGSVSSAGCAVMCSAVHPLKVGDEHQPQSAAPVHVHDHAACDHENGISHSETSDIAARHGVSCNPDCKTWLKLSARQTVPTVAFKNGGLRLPKSTSFEPSGVAASPAASASFSSVPPAKRGTAVLRV